MPAAECETASNGFEEEEEEEEEDEDDDDFGCALDGFGGWFVIGRLMANAAEGMD